MRTDDYGHAQMHDKPKVSDADVSLARDWIARGLQFCPMLAGAFAATRAEGRAVGIEEAIARLKAAEDVIAHYLYTAGSDAGEAADYFCKWGPPPPVPA
jgi:hypothetical protein